MKKKVKDVIFIIQGYDKKTEEGGLIDCVSIEVYAKTEEEAIIKATNYIKKNNYRVQSIIEK